MKYYFQKIKEDKNSLNWILNKEDVKILLNNIDILTSYINDNLPSFEEKKAIVLNSMDLETIGLEVIGRNKVVCPRCGDKSAYVVNGGNSKYIQCNHRSSCGFYGDFISVYGEFNNLTYKDSFKEISNKLNINFNIDEVHIGEKRNNINNNVKSIVDSIKPKEINYLSFNKDKKFIDVDINNYISKYSQMNHRQKFMTMITVIYNFSITTNQNNKINYYNSLSIINHPKINNLGCLSKNDIPKLIALLKEIFPTKELIQFGILKDDVTFKISFKEALVVVPNDCLYNNLKTAIKFRKTVTNPNWINSDGKEIKDIKEYEMSYGRIANPIPYGLTRESLLNKNVKFRFFEGQKDLHSVAPKENTCDIAITGVNGISKEMLGLFRDRVLYIYFDQDKAGQKGAEVLAKALKKVNAIVFIKKWDSAIGSDVNEVLQNGFINIII